MLLFGDPQVYSQQDIDWFKKGILEEVKGTKGVYYQAYTRWDLTDELMAGRRPSEGEASSHLWTGAISTELPVGVHTLYVRATDMFRRVFTHEQVIRIEKPMPKVYE